MYPGDRKKSLNLTVVQYSVTRQWWWNFFGSLETFSVLFSLFASCFCICMCSDFFQRMCRQIVLLICMCSFYSHLSAAVYFSSGVKLVVLYSYTLWSENNKHPSSQIYCNSSAYTVYSWTKWRWRGVKESDSLGEVDEQNFLLHIWGRSRELHNNSCLLNILVHINIIV